MTATPPKLAIRGHPTLLFPEQSVACPQLLSRGMASTARDATFKLRLSSHELAWFQAIARERETSLSELVRLSLATEGARLGVPAPVPVT